MPASFRSIAIRSVIPCAMAILSGCQRAETGGKARLQCDAARLQSTVVTPHLEQPIAPGTNVLWCASFQVAWNELCDLAQGEVLMENEDPMVGALNRKGATRDDLDDATHVSMAGLGRDGILGRIRNRLEARFGETEAPELLSGESPAGNGVIAYSSLLADLPFASPFTRLRDEMTLGFAGADVESFGIYQYLVEQETEARAARQVRVFDRRNDGDFIVELETQREAHRLFLAKVPPRATLRETVESVLKRVEEAKPVAMAESGTLAVPVLDFDILRDYAELTGRPLRAGKGPLGGMTIDTALQKIRFRLDESGALLKSEAVLILQGMGRDLIFDKPFLVMIRHADAKRPYFALWVDNADLLAPIEKR